MKAARLLACLAIACVWLYAARVWALPAPTTNDRATWVWAPAEAYRDVSIDDLRAQPPHVVGVAAPTTGPVRVGPGKHVLVYLTALSTMRVRKTDPSHPGDLRFRRLAPGDPTGAGGGFILVDEDVRPNAEGSWILMQSPAEGAAWLIDATHPLDIVVETPAVRNGKVIWEFLEDEIIRWIGGDGGLPTLPPNPGTERYRRRLLAAEQLEAALLALGPKPSPALRRALRSWRRARAITDLVPLRPLVRPFYAPREFSPPGALTAKLPHLEAGLRGPLDPKPREYAYVESGKPWTLEAEGPGALHVEARGLWVAAPPEGEMLSVVVRSGGRELARSDVIVQPAVVRSPATKDSPVPTYVDATTQSGARVSLPVDLSIPLLHGEHRYEVSFEGPSAIARVRYATRTERTTGLAQKRTIRHQIASARRAVAGEDTLAARVVLQLLAEFDGTTTPLADRDIASLSQHAPIAEQWLAVQRARDLAPGARARMQLLERLLEQRETATPVPGPLGWDPWELELRQQLFELFHGLNAHARGRLALETHARSLDDDALVALVSALPPETTSRFLSHALELVRLGVPLRPDLRRAYRELWRRTQWVRLGPNDNRPRLSWLEAPDPSKTVTLGEDLEQSSNVYWPMTTGQSHMIRARPHPHEAGTRSPVLRVLAFSQRPQAEPLTFRLDDTSWSSLALETRELFEVITTPGTHRVQFDAPPTVSAFVSLPPAELAGKTVSAPAREVPSWSLRHRGRPLAWNFRAAEHGAIIRIDLRRVHSEPPSPDDTRATNDEDIAITVHAGTKNWRLLFRPGSVDSRAHPLDAPGLGTERITVTIPVDPGVEHVWLTGPPAVELAASLSIRRWIPADEPKPAPPPVVAKDKPDARDPFERLTVLSDALGRRPEDADLLFRRAHLLLDLDEPHRARQDLRRLLLIAERDALTRGQRDELATLTDRLRWFVDRDYVQIKRPDEASFPILLQPALAALGVDGEHLQQVWTGSTTPTEEVATAFEARKLQARDELEQAAHQWSLLYRRSEKVAFGYAAATLHLRAYDEQRVELSAVSYGLARKLDERLGSPIVRRLLTTASQHSRWVTLGQVDDSAGIEHLHTLAETPSDLQKLREALVAAPWPRTGVSIVQSDQRYTRPFTASPEAPIMLEAWCQRTTLSRVAEVAKLDLTVSVDDGPATVFEVGLRAPSQRPLGALAPGPHRVLVELPPGADDYACALRLTRGGEALAEEFRPSRWFLTQPGRPVAVAVLGPTVLRVAARRRYSTSAPRLTASVLGLKSRRSHVETHVIPDAEDPSVRASDHSESGVGQAGEVFLFLPEGEPHLVTLYGAGGSLLLQIAQRQPVEAADSPADTDDPFVVLRRAAVDSGAPEWPAPPAKPVQPAIGEMPPVSGNRIGTFEGIFNVARDDVGDNDDLRPRHSVRGTVSWHRELFPDKVWARIDTAAQWREHSGGAYGISGGLYGQLDPRRLRGRMLVQWWGEQVSGKPAWSHRGLYELNWPFQLAPRLALVPRLEASYVYQSLSLTEYRRIAGPESVHPQVYTTYRHHHPFALTPRLELRWRPLQDLQVTGASELTTNADVRSADHLDLEAAAAGLIDTRTPLLLTYRGGYQQTYRFEDDHRDEFFLRHRLQLGFGLSFWFVGIGRISLEFNDYIYMSKQFPVRNAFTVGIGFSIDGGRGVRDVSPMELNFRELYQFEWWREAGEDDLL